MSLTTALPPPAPEQWPICFPVTSALHSPAATYVRCYLVPSQLLNVLHFPPPPWQHAMHFLSPMLPNGPVYPSPRTVHHSSLPFQGTLQWLWLGFCNVLLLPSALSSLSSGLGSGDRIFFSIMLARFCTHTFDPLVARQCLHYLLRACA